VSEDKWQRAAKHAETVFSKYVAVAVGHALMDCEKAHPGYRDWLAEDVLGTRASVAEREAPSREDVAVTLDQALLGSYDDPGDLIHPDSQIPAGEIQRLIREVAVPMLAILFRVREEERADSCFEAGVLAAEIAEDDEGGQR
jgi:hypothetical protein